MTGKLEKIKYGFKISLSEDCFGGQEVFRRLTIVASCIFTQLQVYFAEYRIENEKK